MEITDFVAYYKEVLALVTEKLQAKNPESFIDYGDGEEYVEGNIVETSEFYNTPHLGYRFSHVNTHYDGEFIELVFVLLPESITELDINSETGEVKDAIIYMKLVGHGDSYDGTYFDIDDIPEIVEPTIVYHEPTVEYL